MKKSILFVLLFVFMQIESKANKILGAEISYKHIGSDSFELTLKYYKDCGSSPFNIGSWYISDQNNNNINNLSFSRVRIEDISPICFSQNSPQVCSNVNNFNSGSYGIEVHTFKSIVDFNQSPFNIYKQNNSCEIILHTKSFYRYNNSIIPNFEPFYTKTELNICGNFKKNSSPILQPFNQNYINIGQTFDYTFGAYDPEENDSISYLLVNPKNDTNQNYIFNYNLNSPLNPYCGPNSNTWNCKPEPESNPALGFYFNSKTGRMVFTPTNYEITPIAIQVIEHRKDSNNRWQVISKTTRDLTFIVDNNSTFNQNYRPKVFTPKKTIVFKANQMNCIEIKAIDTLTSFQKNNQNNQTIHFDLITKYKGSQLTTIDSSSTSKTSKFCWYFTDSLLNILSKTNKLMPLILNIKDNHCDYYSQTSLKTYIQLQQADSLGIINFKTFYDKNKNGLKENNEPYEDALVHIIDQKKNIEYKNIHSSTNYIDSFEKGYYLIGIANHPYKTASKPDTFIQISYKSSQVLELGFYYQPGVYGKIYNDKNQNCQLDSGENTLTNEVVIVKNTNLVGISDQNGEYYIPISNGNYEFGLKYDKQKNTLICPSSNAINLNIGIDSVLRNIDFALNPKSNFKDISIFNQIISTKLNSENWIEIIVKNEGTNKRLNHFFTIQLTKNNNNANLWGQVATNFKKLTYRIDSIQAGEQIKLLFPFNPNSSIFSANDTIFLNTQLDPNVDLQDSNNTNNRYKSFKKVNFIHQNLSLSIENDSIKTSQDEQVSYLIHLKNTLKNQAQRIIIQQIIDTTFFDFKQFKINSSTHPINTFCVGNKLYFTLEEPLLIDEDLKENNIVLNYTLGIKRFLDTERLFNLRFFVQKDIDSLMNSNLAEGQYLSPFKIETIQNLWNCENQMNQLTFTSRVNLENNNIFNIELSDSTGSFNNPIAIGSKVSQFKKDSIPFILPLINQSGFYKLRIKSSLPNLHSFSNSGITKIYILKKEKIQSITNLENNELCENELLNIELNNPNQLFQVFKNQIEIYGLNDLFNIETNIKNNDEIKILMQDSLNICKDTLILKPVLISTPNTKLNIESPKTTYCENETINLNITGAHFFRLYVNQVLESNNIINNIYQLKLKNNSEISVLGINANGCLSFSDTLELVVNPLPKLEFEFNKNPICKSDSLLILFSDNSISKKIYQNNLLLWSSFDNQFKILNPKNNDSFYCILSSPENCQYQTLTQTIEITEPPIKPIIIRTSNHLFVNNSTSTNWYKNGVLFEINKDSIFDLESAVYQAEAYNSGCSVLSEPYLFFNTKIENPTTKLLKIFPNPSNGLFYIINSSNLPMSIDIYNPVGVKILSQNIDQQIATINLDNAANGVYLVKVTINDYISIYKITITD